MLFVFGMLSAGAQGYNIEVKIKGFAHKNVILGHYFSNRMLPDDTVMLNNAGIGHLKGKTALPGGMYFLFLPNRSYFDLLINKNQHFTIQNDTTDFLNKFQSPDSRENQLFYAYQKSVNSKTQEANKLKQEQKTADAKRKKVINKRLQELQKQVTDELNTYIKKYPDTFLAAFLRGTKEVEVSKSIPDSLQFAWYLHHYFDNMPLSDSRFIRTPIFERKVNAYLKLLDQLPADTIIHYVDDLLTRVGVNKPKGQRNEELFRFMLVSVHNHYASSQIMGQDAVFVHIAEDYYIPKAYWSDADYIKKLKDNIAKTKPNLIGNKAPELVMQKIPNDSVMWTKFIAKSKEMLKQGYDINYKIVVENSQNQNLLKELKASNLPESKRNKILRREMDKKKKNTNEQKIHDLVYREYVKIFEAAYNEIDNYIDGYPDLYQIKADNTVLWFWEPDCSHCQHETPIMIDFYNKFNKLTDYGTNMKNLVVYSVYLPRAIDDWQKFTSSFEHWFEFVKKHNMGDWLNVWDPYGETEYRTKYNVYSTPTVYLLDSNKKIIAKRIGVAAVRRILLDNYIHQKAKNLDEKGLLKEVDKLINIFNSKEELEDIQTVVKGRLGGEEKKKALERINSKLKKKG